MASEVYMTLDKRNASSSAPYLLHPRLFIRGVYDKYANVARLLGHKSNAERAIEQNSPKIQLLNTHLC